MHAPPIVSAKPQWVYDLGDQLAILFTDIVAIGPVDYTHVLTVGPRQGGAIAFYITAEKNMMQALMPGNGGSHYLCAFEDGAHRNFGSSNDWADPGKFEARALDMACERTGFPRERVQRDRPRATQAALNGGLPNWLDN
jgi:hypothetical protein